MAGTAAARGPARSEVAVWACSWLWSSCSTGGWSSNTRTMGSQLLQGMAGEPQVADGLPAAHPLHGVGVQVEVGDGGAQGVGGRGPGGGQDEDIGGLPGEAGGAPGRPGEAPGRGPPAGGAGRGGGGGGAAGGGGGWAGGAGGGAGRRARAGRRGRRGAWADSGGARRGSAGRARGCSPEDIRYRAGRRGYSTAPAPVRRRRDRPAPGRPARPALARSGGAPGTRGSPPDRAPPVAPGGTSGRRPG